MSTIVMRTSVLCMEKRNKFHLAVFAYVQVPLRP